MNEITRRALLSTAVVTSAGLRTEALVQQPAAARSTDEKRRDRDRVIGAGLTDTEAGCWELLADAAGAFFRLPALHPSDQDEVAQAVHLIQQKLLSRPTYRRYLDVARVKG